MFDELAPSIAELGYHVVAVDLRGHGDSGALSSGNTWAAMNLDLALLARELGPPVAFVAHSFGGGQAIAVSGAFPELVRWVVTIDGLGPPAEALARTDPAEMATTGLDALARIWEHGRKRYDSADELVMRRRRINVRMSEDWARHLVAHGSRATDDGGVEWKFDPLFTVGLGGPFDRDLLLAEYRCVTCPVLVLTGTEPDTWADLDTAERDERVALMPHARLQVIDGAGHYAHLEKPGAVLRAVASFAAEMDG
jgi:pimeloyl-ACP methyl ester carboxylesterase